MCQTQNPQNSRTTLFWGCVFCEERDASVLATGTPLSPLEDEWDIQVVAPLVIFLPSDFSYIGKCSSHGFGVERKTVRNLEPDIGSSYPGIERSNLNPCLEECWNV